MTDKADIRGQKTVLIVEDQALMRQTLRDAAGQRETLAIVRESSKSLLRIIDDILDFSKIEAGKLEVRPEIVSIKQVIEEVQNIYSGNASKGLIVRRTVDPRISPALVVDPVRLRQILNNFVSNAIKFTPEGSIEISAAWVGRAGGQESLRFSVKDTGIGISKPDQQRLFEPFSQAGDEVARKAGGTGLGLSICRRLAELMGGCVEMESEPGKGTTMTLRLSLPIAESGGLPRTRGESATDLMTTTIPMRRTAPGVPQAEAEGTLVLLVDDHPINRMLLMRQVQVLGYAAQSAEDGLQALEMYKSGRFGLVITDCHMPGMDGYQLARGIRKLESAEGGRRMPVIACAANALPGEAEICLAAGMDDYLVKPVELSQLLEKLDRWLPIPEEPQMSPMTAGLRPGTAPATAPVDHALIAQYWGSDPATVRDILAAFRAATEEDAAKLRQALIRGELVQVTHFAHRMLGVSRIVGALEFAFVCKQIDHASRGGDWEAVRSHMKAFERECKRLNAYFESA